MSSELRALVLSRLSYDPDTGIFMWLTGNFKGRRAGTICTKGYRQIEINGRAYMAHTLAWLISYGKLQTYQLDHCNERKDDNWIKNLRDVPQSINSQNVTAPMKNNRLGLRGVTAFRGKFRAHIRVEGHLKSLGYHPTAEIAHQAYVAAKRQMHPGYIG